MDGFNIIIIEETGFNIKFDVGEGPTPPAPSVSIDMFMLLNFDEDN